METKNFAKPQLTIDLEEYLFLKAEIKELVKCKDKFELDIYRGVLTALVAYVPQLPNTNIETILKETLLVLKRDENFKYKIKDIIIEEDPDDDFLFLNVKYLDNEE